MFIVLLSEISNTRNKFLIYKYTSWAHMLMPVCVRARAHTGYMLPLDNCQVPFSLFHSRMWLSCLMSKSQIPAVICIFYIFVILFKSTCFIAGEEDISSLSGKIIECSWDADAGSWVCMRIRTDKSTPNDINTYRKVDLIWNCMHSFHTENLTDIHKNRGASIQVSQDFGGKYFLVPIDHLKIFSTWVSGFEINF